MKVIFIKDFVIEDTGGFHIPAGIEAVVTPGGAVILNHRSIRRGEIQGNSIIWGEFEGVDPSFYIPLKGEF